MKKTVKDKVTKTELATLFSDPKIYNLSAFLGVIIACNRLITFTTFFRCKMEWCMMKVNKAATKASASPLTAIEYLPTLLTLFKKRSLQDWI